ncbi:MAG TPA: hypothetical protein VIF62_37980 [Labilithrix sp.]|jgi:hypothetical protein
MPKSNRTRWIAALAVTVALAGGALAGAACGEDHADVLVRGDGGFADGGDSGAVAILSCGVAVTPTYTSDAFQTNASEELGLHAALDDLIGKMQAAEGGGTSVVTTTELSMLYTTGTPSVRSSSTTTTQAIVDGYLQQFGDAASKTWTADEPESEAGAPTGGKYGGAEIVSPTGVGLRAATYGTLLGGAFYNHALAIASGPVTEATVDRFVAIWGASTKLANSTDDDKLLAAYASQRDDKSQPAPGSYRRMAVALLSAKVAAANGDKCKDDLDAAIKVFLAEWERTTYATAIYFLNDAAAKALASPPNGPVALDSLGTALGLVQGFKGIATDRRKITDAQVDDIVSTIGTPYLLVAHTSDRVPAIVEAIQKIQNVYGFTQAEVDAFERIF